MVDFEGRIDGELFEGGAGKDMPVVIGAGQMLEEFESGLKGIKAGEDKVIEVNFPEDYQGKEVAGKKAEFSLKVTKVSKPVLPEIDAEFAKGFGIEDGDLDKLRSDVRANMEKELKDRLKMLVKKSVMAGLHEKNEIIAPSAMVADEVKSLRAQAAQRMGQDLASIDESMLPAEVFNEEARKRVQLGLLIGAVIQQEKIELDQPLVESTIEDMAIAYEQPDQVRDYYRQNREARSGLESMVLEDQVVALILDKAKVTETKGNFEELMEGSP
jgi:trigger factor